MKHRLNIILARTQQGSYTSDDLDLHEIWIKHKKRRYGGRLDVDMNHDAPTAHITNLKKSKCKSQSPQVNGPWIKGEPRLPIHLVPNKQELQPTPRSGKTNTLRKGKDFRYTSFQLNKNYKQQQGAARQSQNELLFAESGWIFFCVAMVV